MQCLFTRHKHPSRPPSVKTEVALNRERLLLDLGLELDLGRTLRLALNSLRTRRTWACCFARRARAFQLAVGIGVHSTQSCFSLPWGQGLHVVHLRFSLPWGQGVHVVHLRFSLPWGQRLHAAQLLFRLP